MRLTIMTLVIVVAGCACLIIVDSALAAGGPLWEVECHSVGAGKGRWKNAGCTELEAGGAFDTRLLTGETRGLTGEDHTSAKFLLLSSISNFELELLLTGKVLGSTVEGPGTDEGEITFDNLSVASKTVVECGNAKVGPFKAKTLLGYPLAGAEATAEAYDLVFPEGAANLFVEFELTGTNCGLLNKVLIDLTATGSEVKEPAFNQKCGVIAVLGKLSGGGVFEALKSGELALDPILKSPETPLTDALVWAPTAKEFLEVKCTLEAKSSTGATSTAVETGETLLETVPQEPIGWEV